MFRVQHWNVIPLLFVRRELIVARDGRVLEEGSIVLLYNDGLHQNK